MNRSANLLLVTEAYLHDALRQDQFFLVFLPQVNTTTESIDSLEALIRWNHPDHGPILPIQFLAGAEQSGFIGTIGLTVIELALSQYRKWLDAGIFSNTRSGANWPPRFNKCINSRAPPPQNSRLMPPAASRSSASATAPAWASAIP